MISKLFMLSALLFVLSGAIALQAIPPQEGAAAHCDNNREGKSKSVDHTCECARAEKDCKPDDPEIQEPGSKCKTYCRKDDCDCQNKCTS